MLCPECAHFAVVVNLVSGFDTSQLITHDDLQKPHVYYPYPEFAPAWLERKNP